MSNQPTNTQARPDTADAQPSGTPKKTPTKSEVLLKALQRKRPPTVTVLCTQLGWQAHTVRAAISRLRKAGHQIEVGKSAGGATTYQLVPAGATAGAKRAVEVLRADEPVLTDPAPAGPAVYPAS